MSEAALGRPLPARVVRIDQGQLVVQAQPQLGCATCEQGGGCQGGLLGRLVRSRRGEIRLPAPAFACAPGSTVWLSIPPGHLLRIALWTYGLPVVALLAAALILDVGQSVWHWLAVALIGVFAFFAPRHASLLLSPGVLQVGQRPAGAVPVNCRQADA